MKPLFELYLKKKIRLFLFVSILLILQITMGFANNLQITPRGVMIQKKQSDIVVVRLIEPESQVVLETIQKIPIISNLKLSISALPYTR
ncbi:MAG: hypothetical protein ACLFQV_11435 [Vulcanimicrobiota bacterium]